MTFSGRLSAGLNRESPGSLSHRQSVHAWAPVTQSPCGADLYEASATWQLLVLLGEPSCRLQQASHLILFKSTVSRQRLWWQLPRALSVVQQRPASASPMQWRLLIPSDRLHLTPLLVSDQFLKRFNFPCQNLSKAAILHRRPQEAEHHPHGRSCFSRTGASGTFCVHACLCGGGK